MTVSTEGVMLLNFLVNFLLLIGAGRFCGCPVCIWRIALGSGLGSIYAGVCMMPGFYFLGNILWRLICLALVALIAYGLSVSGLRRGLIFSFLSLALGGVVLGVDSGGILGVICGAGLICWLCCFRFAGHSVRTAYVPVELNYGQKHMQLTALQDTGNTLRDPITGRQVLVVGADVAGELLGLTKQQLQNPVESVGILPGLRLIPYRSIDKCSFLLALRLQDVKIGQWQGSTLVAFAPEGLSAEGTYQALTGGLV